jgi:hypothetical protein
MQRRDKNISAQLELNFYASDLLGLQWFPTCARVSPADLNGWAG